MKMVFQNVALPNKPRCFIAVDDGKHGTRSRESLFRTFQRRPITAFSAFGKGWQYWNHIFGVRCLTSHCLIFMMDKRKDNDIQKYLPRKHTLHSMKQNLRFNKGHHLGAGPHASDQQVFEEFLSTTDFACHCGSSEHFTESSKKGTVKGAISLIAGTCIGTGILALPASTAPAGFIPSAVSMVCCWGFLVLEALLLAEVNVALLKQKGSNYCEKGESEVISLRTMAEQTLGKWGGMLSAISYIFLSYTIMIAYVAKAGEVLSFLVNVPASIAGTLFMCIFGILVLLGGTNLTDKVNQLLTAILMGLFLLMVVATPFLGSWSGINYMDWDKVPQTIPVIVFSLVYHDLTPVICAYLGGDMSRIRTSIILGSILPLVSFLIWDAVALGVTPISVGEDPLDFLLRFKANSVSYIVQLFSLLAIASSLIGTLLGFLEFFLEQLSNNSKSIAQLRRNIRLVLFPMIYPKARRFIRLLHPFKKMISSSAHLACFGRLFPSTMTRESKMPLIINKWWTSNSFRVASFALVIFPPLVVSTMVTDAFFTATNIAGAYGMMTLYGIFPTAMAWALITSHDNLSPGDSTAFVVRGGKFALPVIGLCACGVILDQLLLDLAQLPFPGIADNDLITGISNVISTLY